MPERQANGPFHRPPDEAKQGAGLFVVLRESGLLTLVCAFAAPLYSPPAKTKQAGSFADV